MRTRWIPTVLTVLIALAFVMPAAADDAGSEGALITHYDPDTKHLVVIDTVRRQLAVYDVRSEARLLGLRSLDEDMKSEVAASSKKELQAVDTPGEDPPGFERLGGSIRVRSTYATKFQGEGWMAEYYIRSEPSEVFLELRKQFDSWRVQDSEFKADTGSGIQSGRFSVLRGTDTFQFQVKPSTTYPGWIWVRVSLDRKTG
ncbi:MAG: hypothetical protein R3344_02535 [Acidobacteriota bacterium]|nr:hypothetical protein [Acidobacteriota bacterium]